VKQLRAALEELVGLFVEDRLFALAIALWIAAIAAAQAFALGTPEARSILLFAGLVAILLASVVRAPQPRA
jgi:hypothetical protein